MYALRKEGAQGARNRAIMVSWLELWDKHRVFCRKKHIQISGPSTETNKVSAWYLPYLYLIAGKASECLPSWPLLHGLGRGVGFESEIALSLCFLMGDLSKLFSFSKPLFSSL